MIEATQMILNIAVIDEHMKHNTKAMPYMLYIHVNLHEMTINYNHWYVWHEQYAQ